MPIAIHSHIVKMVWSNLILKAQLTITFGRFKTEKYNIKTQHKNKTSVKKAMFYEIQSNKSELNWHRYG